MRKVYRSIKETLFQDTLEILDRLGKSYIKNVSPLKITLPNGSEIIFNGADDPEKLKGLSGVDIVLMDELNEFLEKDFDTINQSIRGKHQENSIYMCHNPVPRVPGDMHWFEKRFKVDSLPGNVLSYDDKNLGSRVVSLKTTYKNNLMCPDHVKRSLEGYKETNPELYKLWALGEYAELSGVIFDNWDIVDSVPEGVEELGVGLDFGFSNDPAAVVKVWANSTDMWIKGLVYHTGLSNQMLYDKMIESGVDILADVVADSAEPKSIADLETYGFGNIRGVRKSANFKTDVIRVCQGYKIHILSGDEDLHREIMMYSWAKDKNGKSLPKPQDGNDHYMDAFLYCVKEQLGNKAVGVF